MPLLNNENWNPDLHPRDPSNGQFIYTDGGLHGRPASGPGRPNPRTKASVPSAIPHPTTISKTKPGITIPPHPANADVDANMRLMKLAAGWNPLGKYPAFYLLVKTDGPWDYKNQPSHGANPQYDAFGNFNYGAAGTALGLDSYTLQNEAGLAQPLNSGGQGIPGHPGDPSSGTPPYGDRPQDNAQIRAGIAYAHSKGY